ncbi:MAG TPA: TIGR01841 family phasin [Sphingomicrobium sp.]|nr:TIGR01841 family phasin [Sphingomicrobium sp.]
MPNEAKADETKVEGKIEAVAKAAEAPVKAVAEKVEEVAAPAIVNTPVIETKLVTKAKPAARRARKASAKAVETVKNVSKRQAKPAKRVRKAAKARKPVASVKQIEGKKTMTYDFNQLFAGFQIPGADKYQQFVADAGERSQQLAAKSQKAAEELTDLAKANVEAFVEASRIAVGGAKAIGQDVIASGREGIEQASDAVKTLAEAKSPAEFFQIQSDLARASFDRMVAETSKLTERVVKLAGEAAEPLQTRASLNAERINTLVA